MSVSNLAPANTPKLPRSRQEVLYWLEGGRISGTAAVQYLHDLTSGPTPETLPASDRTLAPVRPASIENGLSDLDSLIGLGPVKAMVREIQAFVEVQHRRQTLGLKVESHLLHMLFKGPPGTGKTTVARTLGKIFHASNVLSKGHLIEVERADLVGEYIGHTAQKTREALKRAMGGILFVDEAYALARGGAKDFGKEAIDTLVKAMEDQKGLFVLILAGYPQEMDAFIGSNPGLRSRFSAIVEFPEYSPAELVAISRHMLRERQYTLSAESEVELEKFFERNRLSMHPHAGNARWVRNMLEHAMRRQALRLVRAGRESSREALMELRWSDFQNGIGWE